MWKSLIKWNLISLGKGYYKFSFSSIEDFISVQSISSWNINFGYLKLTTWSPYFYLNHQHETTSQVSICIICLEQVFWRPNIIFAIASSLGTLIFFNNNTSKSIFGRFYGDYTRIVVDVDLTAKFLDQVLFERKGFIFMLEWNTRNFQMFTTIESTMVDSITSLKKAQADNKKK